MIVHLGVILVAVALVASNAYTSSTELRLSVGEPVEWGGHTFELVEVVAEQDARTDVARANVRLDGDSGVRPGDHDLSADGPADRRHRASGPG